MFLKKPYHFSKSIIIKGLLAALLLSGFIYLNYFSINNNFLNTAIGLFGLYILFNIPKHSLFIAGFVLSILWSYWIGLSLRYYDLIYLFPIILIGIGLIYGIIFYLFGLIDSYLYKALSIFTFSFIAPFNYNWIKPELIFINSFLETNKLSFLFILLSISLFSYIIRRKKNLLFSIISIFLLFFSSTYFSNIINGKYNYDYSHAINPANNIDIYMPQLNVNQNIKWDKKHKKLVNNNNINFIKEGIENKKDLIILPETAFTTALNKDKHYLNILLTLSKKINIITGSLFYDSEDKQLYNATYFFNDGNYSIGKKYVLVPFGEEIPLPKYFRNLINKIFYNGAKDYAKAKKPTNFIIKNIPFRNAICYEATSDKIYNNIKNIKNVIVISNNAWFTPSIEPNLQKLLLKYYSNKYNLRIYHSINGSKNYIINPK